MHGTEQRARPETRHVCELIRNGRIGKIKKIYAACPGGYKLGNVPQTPVPKGLDWDFWQGPAPQAPYRRQAERGSRRSASSIARERRRRVMNAIPCLLSLSRLA